MKNLLISAFISSSESAEQKKSPRLRKWLNLATFTALAFAFIWAIAYPLMSPFDPYDLQNYLDAGSGRDMSEFFYAPWSLPFFALLDLLPLKGAMIAVNLLNWAALLYTVRVFKGHLIVIFISWQLLSIMYYGQIDGLIAFGLALAYQGLKAERDWQVVIGLVIAFVKFHIGIPLGVGLVLYYAKDWRTQLRIAVYLLIFIVIALFIWSGWLVNFLTVRDNLIEDHSIDFWDITGPAILLLWIPVFLSRTRNYMWWTTTWLLTVPYVFNTGFLFLMILPVAPIIWGTQAQYLLGFESPPYIQIISVILYLSYWWQSLPTDRLMSLLQKRHKNQDVSGN